MLKIQRASAGSGKTYALAYRFILNMLAYKGEKDTWKLRNERQMEDALGKILAITFTNKATNEMKHRIIMNLSLLAHAEKSENPKKEEKKIPYLNELKETIGVSDKEISKAADTALKTILNNYSYFKISTIDSFFQEILRTFAYEANLNDSYQVEIDSTFVTDAAMDAAIDELDTHPQNMGIATFWLKILMAEESKKSQQWNPFNKKSNKIYSELINAIKQLEREDFKEIKERIDNFFSSDTNHENLKRFYLQLKERAHSERNVLLMKIKKSLNEVDNILNSHIYPENQILSTFLKQLEKIRKLSHEESEINFKYDSFLESGTVFKKKYITDDNPLDIVAIDLYEQIDQWAAPSFDSYYKNWLVYGPLLPYLGILIEIRSFLTNILESNNLIQLSDTSFILKKVIGDEDAPFVYERLGNRLDHYLIDEFQDTSRMQWDIIQPLLREGLGKNKESLIIGDPKQSIYRFRNADHRLITTVVPQTFKDHESAGFTKEGNTNWRSHTKIVSFNNYFFKTLSQTLSWLSLAKGIGTDFNSLYSNVVQYANNQEGKGYVEVRAFSNKCNEQNITISNEDENSQEENKDWYDSEALGELGPLLSSLINRGYRQKDIVILVNKNFQGKKIIESLVAYNDKLSEKETKIEFISEESLLISSSSAVQIIIGIIEKLSKPNFYYEKNQIEIDKGKPRYFDWNNLKVNFQIFSKEHKELSSAEMIMKFLTGSKFEDSLGMLMEDLPSPSLPSLVESIIKTFIDESQKKTDAIYLTAFQDLVNEYSAHHLNDPATFVEFWNSKGYKTAISSPEGIDAVQIMTIHKSKGLEFKCVVIPYAIDSFNPDPFKAEWRWVETFKPEGLDTPPVLPVRTTSALQGSIHEPNYKEYFDQIITDKLNTYYVAFTRARNELYIFTKTVDKRGNNIPAYLNQILTGQLKVSDEISELERTDLMNLEDINIADNPTIYSYGFPFSTDEILKEIAEETARKDEEVNVEVKYFKDYYINNQRPRLKSVASKLTPSGE